MKLFRLVAAIFSMLLLMGCAGSPSADRSRVQAPSSQEVVSGEARTRAKARTDLGFEYLAQKQYGTALQEGKTALAHDSNYTPTHNLLALIYFELGDYAAAEESFKRALQLSPSDPEIANNYGWFLCHTKREQESFQYFNMALQNTLYPTPQRALVNAAECAMQMRDYKVADGYLSRALAMNPHDVRMLFSASNLKYQQQQYIEAHGYITAMHKNADPTAASIWLAFRIARKTGNREDEARYLSQMRKKFSDSEEYRKLLRGVEE